MNEMTVGDAMRWLRKLQALEGEGVKVIYVKQLMMAVAQRCANIADHVAETLGAHNDPAWNAADEISREIREEFHIESEPVFQGDL